MLNNMRDGSSSVSPYDTAWVALIRDTNGSSGKPQFPSCLQWIAENQLCDGSWGEEFVFCIYDRLLNTLASVIALTTWNTELDNRNRGKTYISVTNNNETRQMLLNNLLQFLHQLSEETFETLGKDIHLQLHSVWGRWLMSVGEEKTACQEKAELVVRTINLCGGHM
ncbi:hypothetical protein HAX54_041849, partial [Datura stramonium]|nr:hypothetical protein [Datura stramonium]